MLGSIQKLGMAILVASCIGGAANLFNPQPSIAQPKDEAKKEEGKRPPVCQGNPPTGRVKCNYEGADNYEGDFVNGLPDGRGLYVYANGDRYEGQFRNGVPNGRGTFIFKDDARYTGVFQDGTMRTGTVVFANGERYVGEFGVVINVTTKVISSQPAGRGQFFYSNGDRYEGLFFAGSPFGPGVLVRKDGTRCSGRFFNPELDASVTCNYPNGTRYEGELRKGLPHGVGTMIDVNGRRFPGVFRNGKPGLS